MQKQGKIGDVKEGKWEILESDKDGNHLLRRDFTAIEREKLREQTDIAFALPKTLQKIEQDLKTAGFFEQASKLSNHVMKKDKNAPKIQ